MSKPLFYLDIPGMDCFSQDVDADEGSWISVGMFESKEEAVDHDYEEDEDEDE